MIDLDALEALDYAEAIGKLRGWGQRVERDAKRPDPLSQALNEGDGVYRP